ncbi:MAG: phage gp6-like head-tail connector protein [Anaerolineaceae bacterium]|nr:phage gp6-like head-tail connector protein [Anaerolineaceae bacterium]
MAENILTESEAAKVLRTGEDDPVMLDLLPQVDAYIENATGRDWAADEPIQAAAKSAARMLLVRWYEDPGGMAAGVSLGFGLNAALVQLKVLALELAEEESV